MNTLQKLPTRIIFITAQIIFNSNTTIASSDYANMYQEIGSLRTTSHAIVEQYCYPQAHIIQSPNLLKSEVISHTLQSEIITRAFQIKPTQCNIAQKNKTIQKQTKTIAAQAQMIESLEEILKQNKIDLKQNSIHLKQAQTKNKELHNQSEHYKNLAILGGVTTSLAVGFIIVDRYLKK